MKELYGTGVPVPFECKYACKVKSSDCAKIEKALHTAFAPNRINANREFFQIKPKQAMAILELLNLTHAIHQPTGYWMYEGKNLRDIYDETYTLDD